MHRRSFIKSLSLTPLAAAIDPSDVFSSVLGSFVGASAYSGSMWTYLWDVVDEGYERVLRNLEEHRLTSISLATAYHAGKFLEPHNPKRKVVFPEDGTVYFHPDPALYGTIHPRVNSLVSSGHGLEKVKEVADKVGLQTRAWVVCCHNTPIGMQHPSAACEDAFGDKIYHNLCPSNPDVRRYIRSLVSDISSHGVDAIELEALQFQGYSHGFHHEIEGIELNVVAKFLLGLCFCPACYRRSKSTGLDLAPIHSFTRRIVETWFSDPASAAQKHPDMESLPEDLFGPMHSWRESVVSSFVKELVEVAGSVKLRQMVGVGPYARRQSGVNPEASARATGGILVLGYTKDGEALREPLKSLRSLVGKAEITLGLQAGMPGSGGKKEFLDKVSTAKELGIRSFNFYNYGLIPLKNLDWLKEVGED